MSAVHASRGRLAPASDRLLSEVAIVCQLAKLLFETDDGAVRLIDCMPLSVARWDVVRIVEGLRGCVAMRMELVIRFGYGAIVPWVRQPDGTLMATAGPDTLELHTRTLHKHQKPLNFN